VDDDISHIEDSDWYETDNFNLPRRSVDSRINNFGFSLINMCQVYGIHMLNGRFPGDTDGACTFISTSGTSLVDYILVSSSLFPRITDFIVDSRSESDHMPIIAKLTCPLSDINSQTDHVDEPTLHSVNRYKWQGEYAQKFVDGLDDTISRNSWLLFQEKLDTNNTNAAVEVFVDILQRACEPMKCQQPRKQNNRPRRQADWWDAECTQARGSTTHLLNRYRRTRTQTDLDMYCVSKRQYKALCTAKKRCLQRKRFDELKNARQNKAKVWNIVRTLNKRPSQRCEIKPDTLFEHFSTLLSNAPILNDQF
jgi:hypothetical protein